MIEHTTIRTLRRWDLFDLHEEKWDGPGGGGPITIQVYRNKAGDMIDCKHRGRRPGLVRFIVKNGIKAIKSKRAHSVCSIGKGLDGRWYGWSHRAICSFGKGDRIFEERFGNDETPYKKHGKKPIKTDADAKLAARRFAASVS